MARIIGNPSKVLFAPIPPDGEVLGIEGKQVWYGSKEGLGSVAAQDITDTVSNVQFEFGDARD